MYRITDQRHTDAMIAAKKRGIPVRLITEPQQYRDPTRLWHSWNIDRLYMAGVQIKMRAHAGPEPPEARALYSQRCRSSARRTGRARRTTRRKSTTTSDGADDVPVVRRHVRAQVEQLGRRRRERRFVPLPPDAASTPRPANSATGTGHDGHAEVVRRPLGAQLRHLLRHVAEAAARRRRPRARAERVATQMQSYTHRQTLRPGTTYYWRIVSKTMANMTRTGDLWSFTTGGHRAAAARQRLGGRRRHRALRGRGAGQGPARGAS